MKTIKALFTIFLFASLLCVRAAVTTVEKVEPPLPQFLQVYTDVRTCFKLLFEGIDNYDRIRKRFDFIDALLGKSCDSTATQVDAWKFSAKFFDGIAKIPLGPIPKLSNVIKTGSKSVEELFKTPTDKICTTRDQLKTKLEKFDRLVSTKVQKAITKVNEAANKIDKKLDTYESIYKKYVILKNQEAKICPSIVTTFNNLQEWKKSCDKVLQPLVTLTEDLDTGIKFLEVNIKKPLDSFNSKIKVVLNGPLGEVGKLIDSLKKVEVKLPNVKEKFRGAGTIPTCCPPNYKFVAGLCYKNCDSGWENIGLICMKKCGSGYKTVGPTCHKFYWKKGRFGIKLPRWRVTARAVRDRLGSLPARHSRHACACGKNKRDGRTHLEAGLCQKKCGAGSFAAYKTPILLRCWDFSTKTFKIADLTKVLGLFDKLDKVPGIGDILRAANKIVDTVMKPIEKVVNTMFKNIEIPKLTFLPTFAVDVPEIAVLIAEKIEAIANRIPLLQIERDGLCVNVGLDA